MVVNSPDKESAADPDNVEENISIDWIPENEAEEEGSTSTVAAVSISTPDLPATRVLHTMCSDAAAEGYDSDGFLPKQI